MPPRMYDRPVSVYNEGSDDVPAYGIVRVSSDSQFVKGVSQLRVNKPDTTYRWLYMLAGANGIKAGTAGVAYYATEQPAWMLYDDTATSPTIGAEFGPMASSFKGMSDSYGFIVVGKSETSPVKRVLVRQCPPSEIIVSLDASLSYQGSVTASVLRFVSGSSQPDTSMNLTAYDCFLESGSLNSGTVCNCGRRGGRGVITQARGCPA